MSYFNSDDLSSGVTDSITVNTLSANSVVYTANGVSILAGVPGTYSNSNVASYLVTNPQPGTYSNSNVASYIISYTGDVAAGNVSAIGNVAAGNVSATGNVSGTYLLGNGSKLTNVAKPVTDVPLPLKLAIVTELVLPGLPTLLPEPWPSPPAPTVYVTAPTRSANGISTELYAPPPPPPPGPLATPLPPDPPPPQISILTQLAVAGLVQVAPVPVLYTSVVGAPTLVNLLPLPSK